MTKAIVHCPPVFPQCSQGSSLIKSLKSSWEALSPNGILFNSEMLALK
jgi:hypothetical protein